MQHSHTPRLLLCRLFCLLACALEVFLLSSLRVPSFPRPWWCNNFAAVGMVAVGNNFALLGCITINRRCRWHTCTVGIDEFSHQMTSPRDVDSCENSTITTPRNCWTIARFFQNPTMRNALLAIGTRRLTEASSSLLYEVSVFAPAMLLPLILPLEAGISSSVLYYNAPALCVKNPRVAARGTFQA